MPIYSKIPSYEATVLEQKKKKKPIIIVDDDSEVVKKKPNIIIVDNDEYEEFDPNADKEDFVLVDGIWEDIHRFGRVIWKKCARKIRKKDRYEPLDEILAKENSPKKLSYTYITSIRGKKVPKLYIILTDSRIFSTKKGKFITPSKCGGYLTTSLSYDGKVIRIAVHIITGTHFIVNSDPKTKLYVDHIDRDANNNEVSNLRWVTPVENSLNRIGGIDVGRAVLQFSLSGKLIAEYPSLVDAAKKTGTDYGSIKRCLYNIIQNTPARDGNRYIWKHKNEKIKFPVPDGFTEVKEYERYRTSDTGEVYSFFTEGFMKPHYNANGYLKVRLKNLVTGKKDDRFVHVIVARTLIKDKPENYKKMVVNHINGVKDDNHVDNLEFITQSENILHAVYVLDKGNKKRVYMFDFKTGEFLMEFPSIARAATEGRSRTQVVKCCDGKIDSYGDKDFWFANEYDELHGCPY